MTYDCKSPPYLKNTQQWFAGIITRPIDENSCSAPIAPSGALLEEEACRFIKPSPTLRPKQRIEIYNQQYWWRLLNILHDMFPLVTRLFGYHDFNRTIGIPYLTKYPPTHWSLNYLGIHLPAWINEEYTATDKKLVYDAAKIDLGYYFCFLAIKVKPLDLTNLPNPEDASALFAQILYLQPSIHFFELIYDLFAFRMEFLKQEPEYWIDNDFPALQHHEGHYILFSTPFGDTLSEKISTAEFLFLQQFRGGSTLDTALQWLEDQPAVIYEEAENNMSQWLQKWALRQWLSLEKP